MRCSVALFTVVWTVLVVGCVQQPAAPQGGPVCPSGQHLATLNGLVDTRPWEAQTGNHCVEIYQSGVQIDANGAYIADVRVLLTIRTWLSYGRA
jgi:hypothetical protein